MQKFERVCLRYVNCKWCYNSCTVEMNCLLLDNSFIKAQEALSPSPPKKTWFRNCTEHRKYKVWLSIISFILQRHFHRFKVIVKYCLNQYSSIFCLVFPSLKCSDVHKIRKSGQKFLTCKAYSLMLQFYKELQIHEKLHFFLWIYIRGLTSIFIL